MEIKIFDVSHGFCAILQADNNNLMLFDCGHNENTGFRPSTYLRTIGCNGIEYLIIQNFDQDHVSDLHNVIHSFHVQVLYRNRSIPTDVLRAMKESVGFITQGMEAALSLNNEYTHDVISLPDIPNVEFIGFSNNYPDFTDTNNLSFVSFVHYDGMGIIFPGDMEKQGWKRLLENALFCSHLKRVNIFIASHHGRESGYCKEVFDYCAPDITIISDKEIVHETQKQNYAQHMSGVPWNGGPKKRYVLTTRSDGMITINKQIGSGYHISIG